MGSWLVFGKNANSAAALESYIPSLLFLFGDNWSLAFFGAVTSVAALLFFMQNIRKEIGMENKTLYESPHVLFIELGPIDILTASNPEKEWQDDNATDDGWL